MNDRLTYQPLVDKYKGATQLVKKLGMAAMFLQVGIISFIHGWKHLDTESYKIAAPFLFALSIYFLIKDFRIFRRIEENVAQVILDGVELEKKNVGFGNFFHVVLQDFNLARILLQRSLVNLAAAWCLGYLISQFFVEVNPDFVISQGLLILFAGTLSAIACKLYYDSFQTLAKAKARVFAK